MYDKTSYTQLQSNYSSLGPAYDMEAKNHEVTNSYDYVEQPLCTANTMQFKAANHASVRMEAAENDFYDTEEYAYAVVSVNIEKKTKKKLSSSTVDDEEHTADVHDTPVNPTPVRNEASRKEDDFYDAEEHIYSVVNVNCDSEGEEEEK